LPLALREIPPMRHYLAASHGYQDGEFIVQTGKQHNPAIADLNRVIELKSAVQEHATRLVSLLTDLNRAIANFKPAAFEAESRSRIPDSSPEAWIPKRDALQFLGLSERHVGRLVAMGTIRKKVLQRQPHESAPKVVYAREDV
jgi:hypothetical protein